MKLRELRQGNEDAWINPAKNYWDTRIHNKCVEEEWTNEDEMKQAAHGYIDDLQQAYITYKQGTLQSDVEDMLLSLYTYVVMKFGMQVSGDPPPVQSIIPGDDMKNFYRNWTYDIIDKELLFEFEEGEEPDTGKVVTTDDYKNFKKAIEEANTIDSSMIASARCELANSVRPLIIYLLFEKPNTTSQEIDIKNYILQNLHLQDVIDEFNFIIKGINA